MAALSLPEIPGTQPHQDMRLKLPRLEAGQSTPFPSLAHEDRRGSLSSDEQVCENRGGVAHRSALELGQPMVLLHKAGGPGGVNRMEDPFP